MSKTLFFGELFLRLSLSAKRVAISAGLNYRNKLWQYGKQPDEVMSDIPLNGFLIDRNEKKTILNRQKKHPELFSSNLQK
mgnify:FL=1